MKHPRSSIILISSLFVLILSYCSPAKVSPPQITGSWKCIGNINWYSVRFGTEEIDSIKYSTLHLTGNKVYIDGVSVIDTCFYTGYSLKPFFDRPEKRSNYGIDGPLTQRYTEQKLSKLLRVDLETKKNNFGTFYLKEDTLILNTLRGVTFLYLRSGSGK